MKPTKGLFWGKKQWSLKIVPMATGRHQAMILSEKNSCAAGTIKPPWLDDSVQAKSTPLQHFLESLNPNAITVRGIC
jgi:hypothetical protein